MDVYTYVHYMYTVPCVAAWDVRFGAVSQVAYCVPKFVVHEAVSASATVVTVCC